MTRLRRLINAGLGLAMTAGISLAVMPASALEAEAASGSTAAAGLEAGWKLKPFPMTAVRLGAGPFQHFQELNRQYLMSLDPEKLLYNFRVTAGLPAPGEAYKGFEAADVEIRGHFAGHYLSALALMYASTGDEALKARADGMVAELAKCQQAIGTGYLAAFPTANFDRLESGQPVWATYYVLHKIMAGLFDAYQYCGNEQALEILKGMAGYFDGRMQKLTDVQKDKILDTEVGGVSEVLHNLYSATHDPAHLRLAHYFDKSAFLGPLSLEHDNLSVIHGNTHIPLINGAARHYETTGDERFRTATEFFWDRIVGTRTYATGGTSYLEFWWEPGRFTDRLGANNQECCKTHNMLKVTRYLARWTGDPKYADFQERAMFNGILGTHGTKPGAFMYYVALEPGWNRVFGEPDSSFWCCYGTGVETWSKLGDSIYFHDDGGVYVNLLIASKLDWAEKQFKLDLQTNFPNEETATFVVEQAPEAPLALNLHIPYWAERARERGVEVAINGEPFAGEIKPTSYLKLERAWKVGDRVTLRLPMRLRVEMLPDDPEKGAVMYGPLVMAGVFDESKLKPFSGGYWPGEKPDTFFVGDPAAPEQWLKPVEGKPQTFRTVGQQQDLEFVPFWQVVDQRYGVYWPITREGGKSYTAIMAERERRAAREAAVIDRVLAGDAAAETAHAMVGDKTGLEAIAGHEGRYANDGGWFSYTMKTPGDDTTATLRCTYWGTEIGSVYGPRRFDILVDEQKIATQELQGAKHLEFVEFDYAIPAALTRGKAAVTVKFVPHAKLTAGRVFECAMMKSLAAPGAAPVVQAAAPQAAPLRGVPFPTVKIDDAFWSQRQRVNREKTIPCIYHQLDITGRIENFSRAGGVTKGPFQGAVFNDSDVYKWIEAAAYVLANDHDPALDAQVDHVIELIAKAQQPDGYLNTYFILAEPEKRWTNLRLWHELYCAGHLFEAAVAHYEATGKRTLLDVAQKFADNIDRRFGPNGVHGVPGHEEIELALLKLARVTGEPRYHKLAQFFLELRGTDNGRKRWEPMSLDGHTTLTAEYHQDHLPIAEQSEIVGHSVRATYLYTAVAAMQAIAPHPGWDGALDRLWADVTGRKMYLTGGIGSAGGIEGFTGPYDLPNESAYAETCASVGMVFWSHQMNLLRADARYLDVLERALYNGALSGVGLDGETFFYTNPLASSGAPNFKRLPFFDCACCPPNISRLLASLGDYVYATGIDTAGGQALYVNLYLGNQAEIALGDGKVKLIQRTRYPWDGAVEIEVAASGSPQWTLALRLPEGAGEAEVTVNGQPVEGALLDKGYLKISRAWQAGDKVALTLPLPVRMIKADPRVAADAGRVAFMRGPVVYCAEAIDNGGKVRDQIVPPATELVAADDPDLLGGMTVLRGTALRVKVPDWNQGLYQPQRLEVVDFKAVPYFAWNNRDLGEMEVWLPQAP